MTPLRQRMTEDMQLRGLSPNTQRSYLSYVSLLARHYGCSPDQLTEDDLRDYFLYLQNERKLSQGSCRAHLSGIKLWTLPLAALCLLLAGWGFVLNTWPRLRER